MIKKLRTKIICVLMVAYLVMSLGAIHMVYFSGVWQLQGEIEELLEHCRYMTLLGAILAWGISILLARWMVRPVEEMWKLQKEFVANASHELKTPMAVIMANAELLDRKDCNEEEREKCASNILNTTYQMRDLVASMLEISRMEQKPEEIPTEILDFSQMVTDVALSFQLLYEKKGLALESLVTEGIRIAGCEQFLYQMLDVLLDNALKYSRPEGTVQIRLERKWGSCLLCVSNPGKPLTEEQRTAIFKRFYRSEEARAGSTGHGLGLPLAQTIVQAHRGKIWAESADGTNRFYVQLPLKEA